MIRKYIAWLVLIGFAAFITYMGNYGWHQVYPFRFLTMILVGSVLVVLLFSLIKRNQTGRNENPGASL